MLLRRLLAVPEPAPLLLRNTAVGPAGQTATVGSGPARAPVPVPPLRVQLAAARAVGTAGSRRWMRRTKVERSAAVGSTLVRVWHLGPLVHLPSR